MDTNQIENRIQKHLTDLYGSEKAEVAWIQLKGKLNSYRSDFPQLLEGNPLKTLDGLDALLITYADQIQSSNQAHLQTLAQFIASHLRSIISVVHLLPFFPYSSDDGFSVIDYRQIKPDVGNWADLDSLRDCCKLMFDGVFNHISSQSSWFQGYLQDQEPYSDYFLTIDPTNDLSLVTRPRAKPLLTKVNTPSGEKHVWTTFSEDQIDLNFGNPAVLLEIIDILLFYVQQGALLIRLDAVAFLWKEIGTTCSHLPQTHEVIKLLRAVLDLVAPGIILITETNVPHKENISYFGKPLPYVGGELPLGDEAQMVYQFPLAPLVLHTFRTGDTGALTQWADNLDVPYSTATFLNFIASHDGIGVRPAEGILTDLDIQELVDQTLNHGGQVSHKTNPDGTKSVYELNITLYDSLNHPESTDIDTGVKRFMASQAIMLSLAGVPGIYIHSLFGSPNYHDGVAETGRVRSINREKFVIQELVAVLEDPTSRTSQVFSAYSHYLQVRKTHPAFHPLAPQQIIDLGKEVFALFRISQDKKEKVLCIINITEKKQSLEINTELCSGLKGTDLITGAIYPPGEIHLQPFQVLWLV